MEQNSSRRQSRQKVVTVFPFLATVEWYSRWIGFLVEGFTLSEAVVKANAIVSDHKKFARCLIASNQVNPDYLSIPIEGGARKLRNLVHLKDLRLSEHGEWRRIHLKAFEAAYGRSPFYDHFITPLKKIYDSGIDNLALFNLKLHEEMISGLNVEEVIPLWNTPDEKTSLKERGKEIMQQIRPEYSLLEALMRHGKESLLGLLAASQCDKIDKSI